MFKKGFDRRVYLPPLPAVKNNNNPYTYVMFVCMYSVQEEGCGFNLIGGDSDLQSAGTDADGFGKRGELQTEWRVEKGFAHI